MLPLHALPFGFWFITMNPGFIPSDAIQEVIAFSIVPLQKTAADVLAVALMLLSDVWAPTLQQLCGTQECHALKNRPTLTDAQL